MEGALFCKFEKDDRLHRIVSELVEQENPGETAFLENALANLKREEDGEFANNILDNVDASTRLIAFDIGFLLGKMFKVIDPEEKRYLKRLEERLVKGDALVCYPRSVTELEERAAEG